MRFYVTERVGPRLDCKLHAGGSWIHSVNKSDKMIRAYYPKDGEGTKGQVTVSVNHVS